MNVNYYNEFDKGAAARLRELISEKLIPFGYVDERSITEVTGSDVQGFTQCHFFAGIGGWSYALQLAGVDPSIRLWTGSPPCQPFSNAGKKLGQLDERHLAPAFMHLVNQCRPPILFGEQVAAAIGKHWLDDLFTELERQGYTCGAAVLPACSVGAPHKRDRLFFGAQLAQPMRTERNSERLYGLAESNRAQGSWPTTEPAGRGDTGSMADTDDARPQGRRGMSERADKQPARAAGVAGGLADSESERQSYGRSRPALTEPSAPGGKIGTARTNPNHGFWSDADWLGCRDGKFRPVESGTFPLAHGIPARVGRLRGYGNAIVPQVAAEFIKAFMCC